MLKATKRTGRKYGRKRGFAEARKLAADRDGNTCPISGAAMRQGYGGTTRVFRACDHLIPERFARRYFPGCNPHILENLLTVHPSVHARKTAAEMYLYRGNLVSFKQEVCRIGYNWVLFENALAALAESARRQCVKSANKILGTRS